MIRTLWARIAGALLLAGAAGPGLAAEPEFKPGACVGDYAGVPYKVDCGTMVVDEARGDPKSRRITFPVAIVRALEPKGLPPVVYFHGGPGGDAVEGVPTRLKRPAAKEFIAVDQDWIFFDHRGTGLASPSMNCPGTALTDAGPPSEKDADGIIACLKAFKAQGVDLTRYNAVEVAHDVQDMRKALKLDKIDLYGGSYGTRVQAAVQTHAPQGVRAVVQDSPWPPEAAWTVGGPEMVASSLYVVMAKCEAIAECASRYPDLKARLQATAAKFMAAPQSIGGKTYSADDLGGYLMDASYFAARVLPQQLSKIIAGDMSPVDEFMASRDYYAEGQFMTHLCKEEIPFEKRSGIMAGAKGDPVAELMVAPMERIHDICAAVDWGEISPIEQQPVKTTIPTLFLAAEIDPGCPPELTEAAARGYAGSQVVIVTNATHGVGGASPCTRKMIRNYFVDPSQPVDRSCLPAKDTPMAFVY
ncbi:alpha/beta hydrolase [Caulobacter sp. NIBR2454]|uniref:alpha/beta hydrolase n=1 Tax=Caulobacter sp. NIBR2454 TaxID=3015996 RepID=UPI0022B6460F|nr:alpha/beta hydrolase [Caulobacter sp. NIBR2454]